MVRSSVHYIKNIINGKTFHFHHRFNHSSVSFTRYNQTLIFWGSIFHFSIWCFDHFGKLIEKNKWNISHVLLHPVDNFALMRVWSERYFFLIWMSPLLAKLIENTIFLNQSIKILNMIISYIRLAYPLSFIRGVKSLFLYYKVIIFQI